MTFLSPTLRSLLALLVVSAGGAPLAGQESASSRRAEGLSVLLGRIVDYEGGTPIAGAEVEVTGRLGRAGEQADTRSRDADGDGRFTFEGLEAGRYVVTASALGYRASVDTISVEPEAEVRMQVSLSPRPLDLEPIVVVVPRRPAFMGGFEERRAEGRAERGFFLPEDFRKRNAYRISDMFDRVPGWGQGKGPPGIAGRARECYPDVWVNGRLYGNLMDARAGDQPVVDQKWFDNFFRLDEVAALEVYPNPHEVPSRFKGPNSCTAIVIWLRDREKSYARWWKRGLIGAAVMTTLILLVH